MPVPLANIAAIFMPPSILNICGSLAHNLIDVVTLAVGFAPNSINTEAVSEVTLTYSVPALVADV